MFRRFLALMLCLCLIPAVSLAEERAPYEVFTFSASLPVRLQEPLSSLIPDESRILSGAAIQHNGSHYGDAPDYLDSYTALVLVDSAEGLHLYAAAWVENLPWQVNDYTRVLRQTKGVSVSIYKPDADRIPVFSVDYAVQGGIMSDMFSFWGNRLWCVYAHTDQSRGVTIKNDHGGVEITDGSGRNGYACDIPFYLDYMVNMSAFPISHEEAASLASSSQLAFDADTAVNRVYSRGANLRKEPTSKSESLGMYTANVPMIFTGEQKPGTNWPWYQVNIGDTMGWMSSDYVAISIHLYEAPIPLGRTVDICPLYAAIGDTQPAMQLSPGATFHILTEIDGLYHICIPQGEISWAVDVNGVYGYIPKENVLTGYSPSALDAQSAR